MPYPSLLHPEPLPLQQSTADPYLYRRYSNTVLSQSLWGIIQWNYTGLYSGSDKQIQEIRSERVPEELWMEVHDIVQEAVIKTITKKKKCKKSKWLSEEALKIVEKRREAKGKGEKEDIPI